MARMSGGAICTRSDDEICASESEGAATRVSKRSEANPSKAFGQDINTPVGGQRTHSATVSAGRRGFPIAEVDPAAGSGIRRWNARQCGGGSPLSAGGLDAGAEDLSSRKIPAILPKIPFFFLDESPLEESASC